MKVAAAVLLAASAALGPGLAEKSVEARRAAQRFAPKAVLIELHAVEEAGPAELVWTFFDGDSDPTKDFFVDVIVRGDPPTVRLLREPKRELRPTLLDLSRAEVSWTGLKLAEGEVVSKWEGFRLRPRRDGVPCWRARLKEGGPVYFDARTGEKAAACSEPWKGK